MKIKLCNQSQNKLLFLDNLINLGSIPVEAFYPERNYVNIYHAKATAHYGTVLDLFSGNTDNGATIGLWYKHDGWNQKFYMLNDNTIRIAGKCLDLNNNPYNGAKIQLWDCNGSDAQKWVYDTEGLIRRKQSYIGGYDVSKWCIDANSGAAGQALLLWEYASSSWTEGFRGGEYNMRIYSRRYSGEYPALNNVGDAFIGIAKYDNYNNIVCYNTYALWPGTDQTSNYGCNDKSNRGWWDNVRINKDIDYNEGYNATKNNIYSNISYWHKNITFSQYNDIINTGYQPFNSTYLIITNCSTYAGWLWEKYNGIYIGSNIAQEPNLLYLTLISTKVY
jgi:Ricin-type beta-trefoil lectin domain